MKPPKRIHVLGLHDASCNSLIMKIDRAVQAGRPAEKQREEKHTEISTYFTHLLSGPSRLAYHEFSLVGVLAQFWPRGSNSIVLSTVLALPCSRVAPDEKYC
jgi:hypothetical protein